jgi:hypothetical protein
VLFALACALGEASPDDESREKLVRLAFGGKEADESHRARLRVEISRLRRALSTVAEVVATPRGFRLNPELGHEVRVIRPPLDERHASVLALLADGEPWSSSALAVALGASQRTLQRALEDFAARGRVQPFGQGRARRWGIAPAVGTATPLLLPLPTRGD